jgi:hypothetical protein
MREQTHVFHRESRGRLTYRPPDPKATSFTQTKMHICREKRVEISSHRSTSIAPCESHILEVGEVRAQERSL